MPWLAFGCARTPPWPSVWTAVPPLIGAGLVRLHAQPTIQERKKPVKQHIYQKVTDKIIADMEKGELTWLKPWSAGNMEGQIIQPLRHNGIPYNGINVLMLWGAAIEEGYLSPFWMTFKQAKELGTHVRKGERGSLVVYANSITKTEEQDDGSEEERKISFMKGYSVFNVEQIEGLPEHYYAKPEPVIDPAERIAHVDAFFDSVSADIRHGGNRAFYAGGSDHFQMPPFECFRSPEAELGAAFLCADLALTPEPGEDHAAYIQSWLKVLRDDKRAIFQAAGHVPDASKSENPAPSLQASPCS